jgi:hypothetical protein
MNALDCNSSSATVQGYAQSNNKLFEFCNFLIPADFSNKENMSAKLFHAQEHEETIARRRSPLTKEMFVAMAKLANKSGQHSVESVTFDWFCLCRVVGFRVAEHGKKTQSKVDEHEYASGNEVI